MQALRALLSRLATVDDGLEDLFATAQLVVARLASFFLDDHGADTI